MINSFFSEHDVASTLKKFFRELPEPLLAGEVSISFISVSEMNNEDEKVLAYKNLLQKLSVVERCTLKKVLGHLYFVQSLSELNKMTAENLAMVIISSLSCL